jgi:hypothetical protein
MDMAWAADSLAKVYLGVRLPPPEGFISGRGWPKMYKGWETLCLEAAPVKQHADSSLFINMIARDLQFRMLLGVI